VLSYVDIVSGHAVTGLKSVFRFILEKCDGRLVVENKRKKVMVQELINKGFDPDPVKRWKANQVDKLLFLYVSRAFVIS
jgi:hypothetical protein